MPRVRVSLGVVSLLVLLACKGRPDYDLGTPESALASFFAALAAGRVPDDLDVFVVDPSERSNWSFRCQSVGCGKGTYAIVDRDGSTNRVVLFLDYEVTGHDGLRVMRGERSPVHFVRTGQGWQITQFGARRRYRPGDGKLIRVPPGSGGAQGEAAGSPGTPSDAGSAAGTDAGSAAGRDAGPGPGKPSR